VKYLEQALQVRDRQIGGNTPELATLLMALADVYSLLGRIAPALELMRQAVGKLGPGKDRNLSVALEKLGSMYRKTGRYEDAADCYARARNFWGENAETHAEELTANSAALEELAGLLPALEGEGEAEAEAEDSGVSVLIQEAVKAAPAAEAAPAQVMTPAKDSPTSVAAVTAAPDHAVSAVTGQAPIAAGLPVSGEGPRVPAATAAVDAGGWTGWEEIEFELMLQERSERG
jgi:tetratricopeptide (TPR) repeat protein